MSADPTSGWRKDFGLGDWTPPRFFASADELNTPHALTPQAHALRRAFESMGLDGVLCLDNSPLVYFKEVESMAPEYVRGLHKLFWNHGLSPILVLIGAAEVHVYSGLAAPAREAEGIDEGHRLVMRLNRV